MKKLKQVIHNLNCHVCGDKFETTASWGKYCSDACKQKAYRTRASEREAQIANQLRNTVTLLRNKKIEDTCTSCGAERTLLEQTVNVNLCFSCYSPNWTIIDMIKNGNYSEEDFPNDPLIREVKNGEWDAYWEENY